MVHAEGGVHATFRQVSCLTRDGVLEHNSVFATASFAISVLLLSCIGEMIGHVMPCAERSCDNTGTNAVDRRAVATPCVDDNNL